jgi:hypothetical protein
MNAETKKMLISTVLMAVAITGGVLAANAIQKHVIDKA